MAMITPMKKKYHGLEAPAAFRMRSLSLLVISAFFSPLSLAQSFGVNSQGGTGGLVIPSARVLPLGAMTLTYGNYQEPQIGTFGTQQNFSLGLGLLPNVELFGRFANYISPNPGSILINGVSDLSANIKVAIPLPLTSLPQLAFGVNDVTGGAVNFNSTYVVASDNLGPVDFTLGYARGSAKNRSPTFDGTFGGIALRMGDTGLSLLAEHDGQQKHAGLRAVGGPWSALGGVRVAGTVQQSFGAKSNAGADVDARSVSLSVLLPLGAVDKDAANYNADAGLAFPSATPAADSANLSTTVESSLLALRKALVAAGLERVRVGVRDGASGPTIAVEYENHRYAHNEVDALGLVLGLAAELAPAGADRVHALSLKEGLPVFSTSVSAAAYRAFLHGGPVDSMRGSLVWERSPSGTPTPTRWVVQEPTSASMVRIEVKPDLRYTMGTEVGPFDYSLAANVQAIVPLWKGARVYSSYIQPLSDSVNMQEGGLFANSRQIAGVKTVALQQSFWAGNYVLASAAVGKFHYDNVGVQTEAVAFVPGTDDHLRLRATGYNKAPGGVVGSTDSAVSGSYRRMLTPTMSLELGAQRYSDGSSGPSIEWNQWFGDVAVQVNYRHGGLNKFAGLQLSFPLTPRRGMKPGAVTLAGTPLYSQGIRTEITRADQPINRVTPDAVRNLQTDTSLELELLNGGRLSQSYLESQAYRMRQSFLMYARDALQ
jgi:hypothetical protein